MECQIKELVLAAILHLSTELCCACAPVCMRACVHARLRACMRLCACMVDFWRVCSVVVACLCVLIVSNCPDCMLVQGPC